jgi:glutamate synthase (NADPH/NADH) large chain
MTGGGVLVLGPTGRNFAAGMTGGVAYVYDPAETFRAQLNADLVDLETLDAGDEDAVRQLIAAHYALTDSLVAAAILSGWGAGRPALRKVAPRAAVPAAVAVARRRAARV